MITNSLQNKQIKKNNIIIFFITLLISILVILLFQLCISPIYSEPGGDSVIFRIIGKGWTEGRLPYKDLFDHKGPVIFLIDAIAYLFTDSRIGLSLLAIIALSFDLFFCHKIASLFVKSKKIVTCDLFFLLFFISTTGGGNLTEEWNLPFILLCSYLCLKFLVSELPTEAHPLKYSFTYGLSIGLLFMTRPNNAIPILGIIILFTVLLIKQKKIKVLFINALIVLSGFLLTTVPFIVYFSAKDALEDFIYAAFTFNLNYSKNAKTVINLSFIINYLKRTFYFIINLILVIYLYKTKRLSKKLVLFIVLICFPTSISLIMGGSYLHYWLIDTTSFIISICLLFIFIENLTATKIMKHLITLISFVTILYAPLVQTVKNTINCGIDLTEKIFNIDIKADGIHKITDDYSVPSVDIIKKIPQEDKDKVFVYNAHDFYCTYDINIMPYENCKYFCLQPWHSKFNPQIIDSINEMLTTTPPKFIVTKTVDNEMESGVKEKLANNYHINYKNLYFTLYEINY